MLTGILIYLYKGEMVLALYRWCVEFFLVQIDFDAPCPLFAEEENVKIEQ
jgi:hypothetical protein